MAYQHVLLKFVQGVAPLTGFVAPDVTAEAQLITVNLLDAGGITTDPTDGYVMQRPGLKNGGVWSDSALDPGRFLIAGEPANVTETIEATINAGNLASLAIYEMQLQRFAAAVLAYATSGFSLAPCYIANQVAGESYIRYAIIRNIDINYGDLEDGGFMRQVTISIEREPYWRGIAPGANPKFWTYMYKFNNASGFNATNATLITGNDHLAVGTFQNRREWNGAGTALLSTNYLEIPAADIPGDAPALFCMHLDGAGGAGSGVPSESYLGVTSKRGIPEDAITLNPNYVLNAGDAGAGTGFTTAADTGAPISTTGQTNRRGEVSFGTATYVQRCIWDNTPSPSDLQRGRFGFTQNRGRYACFLRCRLSAGSTTVQVGLTIIGNGEIYQSLNPQTLTGAGTGGTGNTTLWEVLYLGVVAFPLNDQVASISPLGTGIDPTTYIGESVALYASRTAGAGNLYISDLIMIPIDECSAGYIPLAGSSAGYMLIDSTGYFLHGGTGAIALNPGDDKPVEYLGNPLTLTPGVTNQIHYIAPYDLPSLSITARVNIVPRWQGTINL